MSSPPSGDPLAPTATKRTSYLELFFDLVFVFAITQLAGMLHEDHTARGWGHAAIMAWLVWWAWSQYTWAGNAIDLERRSTRLAFLAVTGVTLLAAVAIPVAFEGEGLWFAIPYALIRFSGLGLYWFGLRDQPDHQAALRTFLPIASLAPVLVLAGGAAPDDIRAWVWLAAVVVDVSSALHAGSGEFRISPTHFAERHALIVIIALGESVIAVGATASDLEPTAALAACAMAGFAIVATMWWAYFDWVHGATEARLAGAADGRERSNVARDLFTFGYFPIVIGTVVFAVGVEEALLHPTAELDGFGRVAIGVGLTLFLAGFVIGNLRATRTVLVERAVAIPVVLLAIAVLGAAVSALALLGAIAVGLAAVTAAEVRRRAPAPG